MSALGVDKVYAVGCVGNDWRANELAGVLSDNGVCIDGLVKCEGRFTNTYIKPIRCGISDVKYEDPRLDFENYEPVSQKVEAQLMSALDGIKDKIDVLCVCDQMKYGCITERVREKIISFGKSGMKIVVDSRDRISLYTNVVVKPNEIEAARAVGTDDLKNALRILYDKTSCPVIITLGDKGCLIFCDGKEYSVPAFHVEPPLDFCGAGDTFMAAFSFFGAAGNSPQLAARWANAASTVIVAKVSTTGSVTVAEILKVMNS